MSVLHKNKAFATFLAATLGFAGMHRLYLHGPRDRWLWLHASSLLLAALLLAVAPGLNWFYMLLPVLVSALAGVIEAFTIGLLADEKWDAKHNAGSGKTSSSGGWLALTLVATVGAGAVLLIGTISRLFDLLYTGGAYG
jgi:TM2 domain-containing membrane protein YozV